MDLFDNHLLIKVLHSLNIHILPSIYIVGGLSLIVGTMRRATLSNIPELMFRHSETQNISDSLNNICNDNTERPVLLLAS